MTVSPRLPQPVQALWGEVRACRRCLLDPTLGPQLSEDTYVPFPTIGLLPPDAEHATYVLVGAEPSGGWVKSRSQLEARIELGLRNFGDGREAGSVHYAVERWLLGPGEGYYFTDLSKCTVPVKVAEKTRERRYALCSEYLFREITGIKPRAIVAIGREAYRYLRDHRQPDWPAVFGVLHYSIQAQSYRKRLLVDDPSRLTSATRSGCAR